MNHRLPFQRLAVLGGILAAVPPAAAQVTIDITGGSGTGAGGAPTEALVVPADSTMAIPLPEDGVLDYTSITVEAGATLRFEKNARNTPVYLFSSGPIVIDGTIDVSGATGTSAEGGEGGPGGFAGGRPGNLDLPLGWGLGPGGTAPNDLAAHAGQAFRNGASGRAYGNKFVLNPVGGSGGGAYGSLGGSGGGGAIVICSDVSVAVNGLVAANGGEGGGSGGDIRVIAPTVVGNGTLDANGGGRRFGQSYYTAAGGWVRVDALDRAEMSLTLRGGGRSQGTILVARILPEPELSILSVAGEDPNAGPIVLPPDSEEMRPVVVQAANFGTMVDVEVVVTPLHGGTPDVHAVVIDNTAGGTVDQEVLVPIPANTEVLVQVWKR